jgi:hypothetical protein
MFSFSCPSQYELARERRIGLLTRSVKSKDKGSKDERVAMLIESFS